ncbi:MAG TPA: anthranilate synthase component I [Dongiaceae bacterium]|jgi:anthranilate synthase component 1|nr:anthranilate synthase component I [Dongiaceae bacterium]
MACEPAFALFAERYRNGQAQLVWSRQVADLETPVSALLKLAQQDQPYFLLESIEGGRSRGRYSAIGIAPDLIWQCVDGQARMKIGQGAFVPIPESPLYHLARMLKELHVDIPAGLPPLCVGLFGYLGYENVRLMEKLDHAKPDRIGIPDGILIRPTVMVIFDHVEDSLIIATSVRPEGANTAQAAYDAALRRIGATIDRLNRPSPAAAPATHVPQAEPLAWQSNSLDYAAMVAQAKEYIAAGDIFQVVLSQRFSFPFSLPPLALYRALRRVNPSPFLFYFDFGDFAVTGSSPEILVRLRENVVTIRPIAGTRPRGADSAADRAHATALLNDEKELAEHLMLLDLGRNDVGRVAAVGSVKVTERNAIEYYSHVMHIVSNIDGKLRPGLAALDALVAGFPAGTVSGAPKIRAMEIIDELERDRRGLYGGAVGYFSADGSMDTCIALRTAVIKDGQVHVQAGAGIVADSDPLQEDRECQHKARAILRAAEEAIRLAQRQA